MHLNAWVDVCSKAILDVRLQPGQRPDERAAMHDMLDHFSTDDPERYIITVDRGYESYDFISAGALKSLFGTLNMLLVYCTSIQRSQNSYSRKYSLR